MRFVFTTLLTSKFIWENYCMHDINILWEFPQFCILEFVKMLNPAHLLLSHFCFYQDTFSRWVSLSWPHELPKHRVWNNKNSVYMSKISRLSYMNYTKFNDYKSLYVVIRYYFFSNMRTHLRTSNTATVTKSFNLSLDWIAC